MTSTTLCSPFLLTSEGVPPEIAKPKEVQLMLRYRLLGRSGLRVSEICLGTMSFGDGEFSMNFLATRVVE